MAFKSNRGELRRKHSAFIDMAFGRMAMMVEVALKMTAGMPVEFGNMKAQTRHFKNQNKTWRTEVDAEYAAAQEEGFINGHPIKHYTTSGTSAGFFKRAIDTMLGQRDDLISEARKAVGL